MYNDQVSLFSYEESRYYLYIPDGCRFNRGFFIPVYGVGQRLSGACFLSGFYFHLRWSAGDAGHSDNRYVSSC